VTITAGRGVMVNTEASVAAVEAAETVDVENEPLEEKGSIFLCHPGSLVA
jgi:hypothetical protein